MSRIIDEEYYESCFINYLIKIGEISQPVVQHQNPEFYGLTVKSAINSRIRYLRAILSDKTQEYDAIKGEYLRGKRPYGFICMNALQERIDKLNKAISFNRARLRGEVVNQPFDLEQLKKVPMNQICQINANNFFQVNPFRQENSPSNSLFWYKAQNRAQDFATGKSYDVIDVYQAVNNCDFKTACKELSTM